MVIIIIPHLLCLPPLGEMYRPGFVFYLTAEMVSSRNSFPVLTLFFFFNRTQEFSLAQFQKLFSFSGCNCNQSGSERKTCNIVTGQCECRPNVVGLKCDQCQVSFTFCLLKCKSLVEGKEEKKKAFLFLF